LANNTDILLGLDIGTTELKAAAFSADSGRGLAEASFRLPTDSGPDGKREQDCRDVLSGIADLAAALRGQIGDAWRRAAGVGLAAQGGSAILCDRATGEALTPMQLWNDTRPLGLLPKIASRRPAGYWQGLSRLPEPGAGLARIEWLRRRHPDLVPARASGRPGQTPRTLYGGVGEYAFFALTGVWRQDAGNAVQIGCYSVPECGLTADPLAAVDVPLSFVAPLRRGHETSPLSESGGRLLGLPAGIPVAGPYIDHEAGYLSAAAPGARPLQCSLGTAWVGNFVTDREAPPEHGIDLVLPAPVGEGSLILRVMLAGNVTWDWGVAHLAGPGGGLRAAAAVLTEDLLPPDGLVGLPWFTRPNPWDPALPGSGGLLGLGAHTSPSDLLRALTAGMAFEFARMFGPVAAAGIIDRAVLGGGASKGLAFQQLLAALFAPLPVSVALDQHLAGARGSVHAFSPRAALCETREVPCPDAATRARVERQCAHYARVVDAVLGAGGQ
jgi:sugar (pentulose or hexulose) kinase